MLVRQIARVLKVEERKRLVSAHKDKDGTVSSDPENTGWHMTIEGFVTFRTGAERPDVQVGDEVIVTVEKAQ